jgi:hypothetical protein
LQRVAQASSFARFIFEGGQDKKGANYPEHHSPRCKAETAPLSDPSLHSIAHLTEFEVLPELGIVSVIQLMKAITDHGYPDPYDHHLTERLGEQQRRPTLRGATSTAGR